MDVVSIIIKMNKSGKIPYIGSDPYLEEIYDKQTIIGVFDSQKELEKEQEEASEEI